MIVKQTLLDWCKTQIKALQEFGANVGFIPEDTERFGQNFPYCLIQDGNSGENEPGTSGLDYLPDSEVHIILVMRNKSLCEINTTQDNVVKALISSVNADGNALNFDRYSIETGDKNNTDYDKFAPQAGYYANVTVRRITLFADLRFERS